MHVTMHNNILMNITATVSLLLVIRRFKLPLSVLVSCSDLLKLSLLCIMDSLVEKKFLVTNVKKEINVLLILKS